MGHCAGYGIPGYANPQVGGYRFGPGGWLGGGWGRGRGYRHWYRATGLPGWARIGQPPAWGAPAASLSRDQETQMLQQQADWLREQLATINQHIAELED
jgi:hypothetical protein